MLCDWLMATDLRVRSLVSLASPQLLEEVEEEQLLDVVTRDVML